jgi:hypothetical protein
MDISNYQQSLGPTTFISKISANYRPKYFWNTLLQFSWFAITNVLFVTLNFPHAESRRHQISIGLHFLCLKDHHKHPFKVRFRWKTVLLIQQHYSYKILLSCGVRCRVVRYKFTDIPEAPTSSSVTTRLHGLKYRRQYLHHHRRKNIAIKPCDKNIYISWFPLIGGLRFFQQKGAVSKTEQCRFYVV